jgi:hypothetical protein
MAARRSHQDPPGRRLLHPGHRRGRLLYANICEQCDNFTTSTALLPVISEQLRGEHTLHEDATLRGWTSEAKRHE